MSSKRMTANPLRPARYRAGAKPAGASSSSSSDSEDASDREDGAAATGSAQKKAPPKRTIAPPPKVQSAGTIISSGNSVAAARKDEEARRAAAARARAEAEAKAAAEGWVSEKEEGEEGSGGEDEESGSEEEDGSEEDSDEESSSEEEAAPRRLMVRPKFVMPGKNGAQQPSNGGEADASQNRPGTTKGGGDKATEKSASTEEEEAAAEAARRLAAADALVEEQLRKNLTSQTVVRKQWESDEASGDEGVDTDDSAGDSEAEYALWRLRELKRIRRDREAIEEKERERAEVERRRNLSEAERAAEDEAHLARQREERESRGKTAYLQKYHHRGAFFQDESRAEGLDKRDIMGARFADEVRNRELLPKALQLRDMTKLGRKGASKYKDLRSEDTGQWGNWADDDRRRGRGDYDRFGDERFRPDFDRERGGGGDGGGRGANAVPLGERKAAPPPGAPDGPRRDRERDQYRPREDDDVDRESRRSRSPRGDRGDGHREHRKRESSRDRDYYESDKRRRVDTR